MPRRCLVITADDFGIGVERDRGIVECFMAGAVTRASLLVNGVSAKSAVRLGQQVDIPLGLHLNLTEGSTVSSEKLSTLIKSNGCMLGKNGFRECLSAGEINMSEVKTEIRAQIELFISLTGSVPFYVDGHQHVHVLPVIRDVLVSVLTDYGISWTRLPTEDVTRVDWLQQLPWEFLHGVMTDSLQAKDIFDENHIKYTNSFVGLALMGENMSVSRIQESLVTIFKDGDDGDVKGKAGHDAGLTSCEWMVHPGYPCTNNVGGCGDGPDNFTKSPARKHESDILTSSELLSFYQTNNIELCSQPSTDK